MALSLNHANLITTSQPTTVTTMKDLKIVAHTANPFGGATATAVSAANFNNNGLSSGNMGKAKGLSMLGMPLVSPLMMLPNPLLQMLTLKNEIAKQQQQQQQQQQPQVHSSIIKSI